jgi:mRNA interferase MazF
MAGKRLEPAAREKRLQPAARPANMQVQDPGMQFPEPLQAQVWWLDFDPSVGTEIRKRRPALIVSPNDLNRSMPRVIVAPLTTHGRALGCRPELRFKGKRARILLDQIRSVDKSRLVSPLGEIPLAVWKPVLLEMFA